jgi:hypothetical protein
MTDWQNFAHDEPDLAAKVQARLEANTHHVMATLRADGSPRLSGTEVRIIGGQLMTGSMWQARKALDLERDPRCAFHTNPSDPTMDGGDAKIDALAVEIVDEVEKTAAFEAMGAPPGPGHLFRYDLVRVVLVEVEHDPDGLLVTSWRPGAPVTVIHRA